MSGLKTWFDGDLVGLIHRDEHGAAVSSGRGGIQVPWCEEFARWPLTIEVRGWFTQATVPILSLGRSIERYWQLMVGMSSDFACEIGGFEPAVAWTDEKIVDGSEHTLALCFDGVTGKLFLDGEERKTWTVRPVGGRNFVQGPLIIGGDDDLGIHSSGGTFVREVRISRGIRLIQAHAGPWTTDGQTLGHWVVDDLQPDGRVPDRSGYHRDGKLTPIPALSLDERDRLSFNAGPAPCAGPGQSVVLTPGSAPHPDGAPTLSLDGAWQMGQGLNQFERLAGIWDDAISAPVPGSVHTALVRAGRLADPTFALNEADARLKSFSTWWYRKTFPRPQGAGHRLEFDGVAIHCNVWLNRAFLGQHEGMFGGPSFDVSPLLADVNELIVCIDPAPIGPTFFASNDNNGWRRTAVFNCVYGWHYCNIPALGIWRSVRIAAAPTVKICNPFIVTRHAQRGQVSLRADLLGPARGWRGKLIGTITPENFTGSPHHFEHPIASNGADHSLHLTTTIPDAHPWWPNGMGDPNLYRLHLSFIPDASEATPDTQSLNFGLRTIDMQPLPGGPSPRLYNWTFVINGRPTFIKGTGWCTMDPLMDFRRERYDRFLTIARLQNCQMLRAWGAGMPETDEFYDLCDRYGLLVMQEWPTAWNSHDEQPMDVLEETVRLNTLRLRNHPALAMWGAGNESHRPSGPMIDMMGRLAIELDGSRPFHRGEPWGGSRHDYGCWWGRGHLDHNVKMTARFWGEFGIASFPVHESVLRYLPEHEKDRWPALENGALAHHTPIFNTRQELDRLRQYAGFFSSCQSLSRTIMASQMAQAVALRHTLERARARWPECSGALYYKLNDNYPAASWSTADWYGAIKLSHWFCQSAFAPLHAFVLPEQLSMREQVAPLPVMLVDDNDALAQRNWHVEVRLFGAHLQPLLAQTFRGRGSINRIRQTGMLTLEEDARQSAPLLMVVDTFVEDWCVDRWWAWFSVRANTDMLFDLPRTELEARGADHTVTMRNTGSVPALGVMILQPGHLDSFLPESNCLWLDPGQEQSIRVNETRGLVVEAWNVARSNVT